MRLTNHFISVFVYHDLKEDVLLEHTKKCHFKIYCKVVLVYKELRGTEETFQGYS